MSKNNIKLGLLAGVRFASSKGLLTLEQVMHLPLTSQRNASLQEVATNVHLDIQQDGALDFVGQGTAVSDTNKLKMAILEEIIEDRKKANAEIASAGERKAYKQKLLAMIAAKQDEALSEKSLEDLEKEVASL